MDLQEQMKEYSALKALQIILALAEQKGWVNISDIAEATGLSPSTVHRILQELQACGFVSKNKEARQYKLGMGMMNIALKVNMSDYLLEAAQEEMIRLNELSLETIHLIAPDNDKAVYIGKMDAKKPDSAEIQDWMEDSSSMYIRRKADSCVSQQRMGGQLFEL